MRSQPEIDIALERLEERVFALEQANRVDTIIETKEEIKPEVKEEGITPGPVQENLISKTSTRKRKSKE